MAGVTKSFGDLVERDSLEEIGAVPGTELQRGESWADGEAIVPFPSPLSGATMAAGIRQGG